MLPSHLSRLGVVLTFGFITGCGAKQSPAPPPPPPTGCGSAYPYLEALAEATIACTGTISPDSFLVDGEGALRRNFKECPAAPPCPTSVPPPKNNEPVPPRPAARALQDVDDLLALQHPLVRENLKINDDGRYRQCFVEAWHQWKGITSEHLTCPMWEKIGSEGDPRTDVCWTTPSLPKIGHHRSRTMAGGAKDRPDCEGPMPKARAPYGKQSFRYRVSFGKDSGAAPACGTAAQCALKCASLAKFTAGADGTIMSDPGWWLDPTNYAEYGIPSPYRYPDYYHQMYEAGEIYGHRNREGDPCSLWTAGGEDLGSLLGGFCSPYGCMTCCRP